MVLCDFPRDAQKKSDKCEYQTDWTTKSSTRGRTRVAAAQEAGPAQGRPRCHGAQTEQINQTHATREIYIFFNIKVLEWQTLI